MHNDTVFLLGQLRGIDCCGRFMDFKSPFWIISAVVGFLNSALVEKTLKDGKQGSSTEIPQTLPPPNLQTPFFQLHNSMSQGLIGEVSNHRKCPIQERATLIYSKVKNYKKQEEKIKIEQEKWKGALQ